MGDVLEEWKMNHVHMEMQDVEVVALLVDIVQHGQGSCQLGGEGVRVETDRLVAGADLLGFGVGLASSKQCYFVSAVNQGIAKVSDDPFSTSV